MKKIWKCFFFLKTRIEYKSVCVCVRARAWERDGGGWTDPQWWCQRAESGCLGCHNVAASLRDITHINSLSHTHSRSLQDVPEERSERGVSSTPVLPKPSIKLTWSESNAGLGTPSASRQQYTLACQTRAVHASCTCSHWPPSHTRWSVYACVYYWLEHQNFHQRLRCDVQMSSSLKYAMLLLTWTYWSVAHFKSL